MNTDDPIMLPGAGKEIYMDEQIYKDFMIEYMKKELDENITTLKLLLNTDK